MMPLPKPYPPNEIDYQDWGNLSDNYAGKAATLTAIRRKQEEQQLNSPDGNNQA